MPNETNHKRYKEMHDQLRIRILSCYIDLFILEDYEQKSSIINGNELFTYNHIINLLQQDLCLGLSSICFDESSNRKANSLLVMEKYLKNVYESAGMINSVPNFTQNEYYIALCQSIKKYRNKRFAHLDTTPNMPNVKIKDLRSLLDSAKDELNQLCYKNIHTDVKEISITTLNNLRLSSFFAFLSELQARGNNIDEEES